MSYVCSICRRPDHNRQTCSKNPNRGIPRVTESASQRAARLVVGSEGRVTVSEAARQFGVTRQAVDKVVQRFRAVRT